MNFIYPGFLFALSAISIPVIIHLFNFRRFKKVFFTNVRFLQEIKQDTRARTNLKHLLILIARCLAIIFLVLAFAQPYIPSKYHAALKERNKISIYIDNSFSMDAVGKNGSLVEEAKKKAHEITAHYGSSDQFQLLTNDFEARHQRLVSKEEMINLIDEVQPGSSVRKLSEIIERQRAALITPGSENSALQLFEISDFQKSTADIEAIKNDTMTEISFVVLGSQKENNLYIDSCWLSSPVVQLNAPNELTVVIRNNSTSAAENIPVKLTINGTQRALASVNIPENGTVETKLNFTINQPGWQSGDISITDYPVTFDDNYYLSFNVRSNIHVLAINGANGQYLDALFSNDSLFSYKQSGENQVDYSSLGNNQLIVLNGVKTISSGLAQELKKFTERGGSLVVFPATDIDFSSYQQMLGAFGVNYYQSLVTSKEKVDKLSSEHYLFRDVFQGSGKNSRLPENIDLPMAEKYFSMSKTTRSKEEVLMKLSSGGAFFTGTTVGRGKVYLSAVPMDDTYSNFVKHALFVPTMLRIALISGGTVQYAYTIGRDNEVEFSDTSLAGENVFHLVNDAEQFDIIPELKLADGKTFVAIHDQVKKAGNYNLMSGKTTEAVYAFNYDRKESDLAAYSNDELTSEVEKTKLGKMSILNPESQDLGFTLSQEKEGLRLWKWCIILALLFFATEVALIRWMKG